MPFNGDRRQFWERVYCAALPHMRALNGPDRAQQTAKQADQALVEWESRWGKKEPIDNPKDWKSMLNVPGRECPACSNPIAENYTSSLGVCEPCHRKATRNDILLNCENRGSKTP